jgi:hypothetical protein
MSDVSQGPGWWLASDDRWYPPTESTGGSSEPANLLAPSLTQDPTVPTASGTDQADGHPTTNPEAEPAPPRNGLPKWAVVMMAVVFVCGVGTLGYSFFVQNAIPSNETATTTGMVTNCFLSSGSGYYNTATFQVGAQIYSAQTTSGHRFDCVYTEGQNVTVHYDPSDPSSASLPLNYPAQTFGLAMFGAGFFLVLFVIVGLVIRRRRRASVKWGQVTETVAGPR